jgi:hypothetical protein
MQPQSDAERKAAERRAAVAVTLANLPSDLGRSRVLDAAAASAFWGVSPPTGVAFIALGKCRARSKSVSAS